MRRYGDAADVQAASSEVGAVLDGLASIVENRFAEGGNDAHERDRRVPFAVGQGAGSIARAEVPATGPDDADTGDGPPLTIVG